MIEKPKRRRRKPWDRRKDPYIRAHMEIAQKHGLKGHLHMGYMIFWDCRGDWEKVEQWFQQPNVKRDAERWKAIHTIMLDHRFQLEGLYAETEDLYDYYTNQSTETH